MPRHVARKAIGGARRAARQTTSSQTPPKILKPWEPFGLALSEAYSERIAGSGVSAPKKQVKSLLLWSDIRPRRPEILDPNFFFRTIKEMPTIERSAFELCRFPLGGRVLDVGGGAGSHVLALEHLDIQAEAIDVSTNAVELMKRRGVQARWCSMWDLQDLEAFSTILLLMNTIGAVGSIRGLHSFLQRIHQLSSPTCRVVFDTSLPDWELVTAASQRRAYPFMEKRFRLDAWAELECHLTFGDIEGAPFQLFFAEPSIIVSTARSAGWHAEVAYEDSDEKQVLFQLTKIRAPSSQHAQW